jgi:two-component system phosphate regulon sensor histidine kinase PhoR
MKKKILMIFTVLILIGVITTGIISLRFSRDEYIQELELYMTDYAQMIALNIGNAENFDFDALTHKFSQPIESRVTIIAHDGIVIGDSEADLQNLDNHGTRPEVLVALEGAVGAAIRYSDTLMTDLYYVAYPIKYRGETLIIRISKPMYEIQSFSNRLIKNYVFAIFAGTIIAMIIGLRFEAYLVRPIQELITMTKRIADGNFGEKIYTDSDDEIQELSNSFNIMSEELKSKIDEIEFINLQLQSILDSMVNGIIALDNKKRVLFINPQAERILRVSEGHSVNRRLIEVFRNHAVYSLLEEYFENQENITLQEEIEYNDGFYIVNINPIYSSQDKQSKFGALILIQDITEIKKLENMRKDFVANVSHELKTPLTSIRGFVETLRHGGIKEDETRNRFLEIIEIESNRLTNLIQDTLMLSEIEQGLIINQEVIPVRQSIEEIVKMMAMTADNQGISLICENHIPEDVELMGNRSWFKQILINMIDNAIKYNRPEGRVVLIAETDPQNLKISVSDTGIGIPEEHHERLFERFYRVDGSRSKGRGGTGLGLAIAKHALISLGGTITLESEMNQGSCFTITIPLSKR